MKTLRLTWAIETDADGKNEYHYVELAGSMLWVYPDGEWHALLAEGKEGTVEAAQLAAESAAFRLLCEGIAAFAIAPPYGLIVDGNAQAGTRFAGAPGFDVAMLDRESGWDLRFRPADATALGCALLAAACGKAGA